MDNHRIEAVTAAISYIEAHLDETLRLDAVADETGYSPYHLHRMFTETAGMTPHDYIRRRQLTEAAWRLVFSQAPAMDIALAAGYESRQAFSSAFKSMYKRTPMEYRKNGAFYPLQRRLAVNARLFATPLTSDAAVQSISYAVPADLPDWMEFSSLVIDGFPCFVESLHRERIQQYIGRKQAIVMREASVVVGAAAFSVQAGKTGSIDFLAVHPQYRRCKAPGVCRAEAGAYQCTAAKALLDFITSRPLAGREVSITTFRQGDKADTGQRAEYMRLGFIEAEFLTEFGYPTQRLILPSR